jgi:hypothetical protein
LPRRANTISAIPNRCATCPPTLRPSPPQKPLSPLADEFISWTLTQRSGPRFRTDPLLNTRMTLGGLTRVWPRVPGVQARRWASTRSAARLTAGAGVLVSCVRASLSHSERSSRCHACRGRHDRKSPCRPWRTNLSLGHRDGEVVTDFKLTPTAPVTNASPNKRTASATSTWSP